MTSNIQLGTRYTSGLMATVLAVVLTMTLSTGPASAATTDTAVARDGEKALTSGQCAATVATAETAGAAASETAGSEMTQLDAAASAELATRVSTLAQEAGITSHTPVEFVQHESVKAYAIEVDGVKATSVTFPIIGDSYVQPSNLTYVLDESGALNQYSESTVVERADGILDLTTYRDGVLVHSAELDPSTFQAGLASESTAGVDAAALSPSQCLMAVLGVSAVAAGIILVLCGGSCSVPITPPTAIVCAACIGGIAVVGGASIPAVMGCFD